MTRPYRSGLNNCKVCGEEYFANSRNADGVHHHDEFGVCSPKCWFIKTPNDPHPSNPNNKKGGGKQ